MTAGVVTWKGWKYYDWNSRLIEHVFCVPDRAVVTRIHASAEELWILAGRPDDPPDVVAAWFCSRLIEVLYEGHDAKGFCGFAASRNWNTSSSSVPHFFALLWFTCLVASGYPDVNEGEFAEKE